MLRRRGHRVLARRARGGAARPRVAPQSGARAQRLSLSAQHPDVAAVAAQLRALPRRVRGLRRPLVSALLRDRRAACRRSRRRSSPNSAGASGRRSRRRRTTSTQLFDASRIDAVFEVEECAFDAAKLRAARDARARATRASTSRSRPRPSRVATPRTATTRRRRCERRRRRTSTVDARARAQLHVLAPQSPARRFERVDRSRRSTSSPRWRSSSRRPSSAARR